jgi:hypothetical protein
MSRMWEWKQLVAGLVLAILSLLVARDYLRLPRLEPTRPGLRLGAEPDPLPPAPERSRHDLAVGLVFLLLALLGLALAAVALARMRL